MNEKKIKNIFFTLYTSGNRIVTRPVEYYKSTYTK